MPHMTAASQCLSSPLDSLKSPVSDPILPLLDRLMALPGAQAYHYQIARQMTADQLPLAAYTLRELQQVTGRSESTCKAAKRWLIGSGLLPGIQELINESAGGGQDFVPCMVVPTKEKSLEEEHPTHEVKSCPDTATCLALEKLKAIGWGEKDGHQIRNPEVFIGRYGAPAVLYALWCAGGNKIKIPAAFVTWQVQEGIQAPEGWQHPDLRQKAAVVPVEGCSAPAEFGSPPPIPLPAAAPDTILKHIQKHTTQPIYRSWFRNITWGMRADALVVQVPTEFDVPVLMKYQDLIREACRVPLGEVVIEIEPARREVAT